MFKSLLITLVAFSTALAHVGGHGADRKNIRTWNVAAAHATITGSLLFQRGDSVHVETDHGNVAVVLFRDLSDSDQAYVNRRLVHVREMNESAAHMSAHPGVPVPDEEINDVFRMTAAPAADSFSIYTAFEPFKDVVKTHFDDTWLYVESNGFPNHQMMVGIKSWQQQVPLPQPYTGKNAWQIPLHPVLADIPLSAKKALYTGAIALAINGVPIFNALNNRGDDAYLFGELDDWGGHCGRADDYHYHIAPLHIESVVGKTKPIAVALDGYPIYGELEPDSSAMAPLDSLNGHFDAQHNYHYHGTTVYPYINGGMRGVVTVSNDQIMPQPHTTPVRPFLQPLKGATITGFTIINASSYELEYTLNGEIYHVNYHVEINGADTLYVFTFIDAKGGTVIQTYKNGKLVSTGVHDDATLNDYALYQNYPNPIRTSTSISYYLPRSSDTHLTIYNQLGQVVAMPVDEDNAMGSHVVNWDASHMPAGIYYYQLGAGMFTKTVMMQVIR